MHDAFDRAVSVVADRIDEFLIAMIPFRCARHELTGDWVVRIVFVDQARERRRHRHGITRRDVFKHRPIVLRREARIANLRGGSQGRIHIQSPA